MRERWDRPDREALVSDMICELHRRWGITEWGEDDDLGTITGHELAEAMADVVLGDNSTTARQPMTHPDPC